MLQLQDALLPHDHVEALPSGTAAESLTLKISMSNLSMSVRSISLRSSVLFWVTCDIFASLWMDTLRGIMRIRSVKIVRSTNGHGQSYHVVLQFIVAGVNYRCEGPLE